jgi:antitoxin component YwqK of YwqJK toxin-antitoxin module
LDTKKKGKMKDNILEMIYSKCKDPYIVDYDDEHPQYIGDFNSKDLYHGYGVYYNEIGRKVYQGYWKNGLMDGKGTFYYKGFVLQCGEWKKGKKHGPGIRYFKKSTTIEYDGNWKNGMKHGFGKLYLRNGELDYEGEFKNDKVKA